MQVKQRLEAITRLCVMHWPPLLRRTSGHELSRLLNSIPLLLGQHMHNLSSLTLEYCINGAIHPLFTRRLSVFKHLAYLTLVNFKQLPFTSLQRIILACPHLKTLALMKGVVRHLPDTNLDPSSMSLTFLTFAYPGRTGLGRSGSVISRPALRRRVVRLRLPSDQSVRSVVECSGLACGRSHKSSCRGGAAILLGSSSALTRNIVCFFIFAPT